MRPSATRASSFSRRVGARFDRGAEHYASQALLQRAVAWRLAHRLRQWPLASGPAADLGAGDGNVASALMQQDPALLQRLHPLQLDLSGALLARNPLQEQQCHWDLNQGLPAELQSAVLLSSCFALQWLETPRGQLRCWCRSLRRNGLLAVAVPTAGSFPQWRRAAARSGVPCTALPLPVASELIATAAEELQLLHREVLRFSRPLGGLPLLREMRSIGADLSPATPLSGGELRRLLRCWPEEATTWEVLLLVGRKR